MESLRAGRRNIEQLLLTETLEEKGMVAEIVALAREKNVRMQRVHRRIMDDLANGGNHQNTALRVGAYPYVDLEDIMSLAQQRNEKPFILILDLLKDPQNVGVLLRVAEGVGEAGGQARSVCSTMLST